MKYGFTLVATLLFMMSVTVWADKTRTYPKPPKHGGVYVVAHRGAHVDIPENTLAAYQKAIDLGCDFVEIDVQTTKDGKFVSVHNSTIDAYTKDRTGKVVDFTLAELRALDIGSRVHVQWKDERIPTFEETLALCKGKIGIYVDLKSAPMAELISIVKKYDMEREMVWFAGFRQLDKLKALSKTAIPMPDPGSERGLPRLIERFDPTVIAVVWRNFSPSFVKTCHAAGSIVLVDESDPTCWDDALAWGADGIQTDHPEKLIAYLEELAP
jgi:glycerophosphoryl diester phosphodiesterase